MFTTGFKHFFGISLVLAVASVAYGYATGGGNVGPISIGWKGGVGDHVGYTVLASLSIITGVVGVILVAFRDADPSAQAHMLGVETVATNPPVRGTFWPVVAAFGAATVVVGLVLHAAVFVLGIVIIVMAAIEWTMYAWADRATGDADANRDLRNQIMAPIEIPAAGAVGIAVGVLAVSRILLSVSANGAVVVAGVVAVLILGGAALWAYRPGIGRNVVAGLAVLLAVGLLAWGVVAAVVGERDFEHHGEEHDEHSETEDGASE